MEGKEKRSITKLICLLFIIPLLLCSCSKKKTTYTQSELINALPSSDLSSLECVYNGIADIVKNGQTYHIKYEAKIKLGASFKDLDIRIDDKKNTIDITAPEVQITDISVSPNLSFIPSNPQIDNNEILNACYNDAREAAQTDYKLKELAQDNFISVIEGLLKPLIKDTKYKATWHLQRIKIVEEERKWAD